MAVQTVAIISSSLSSLENNHESPLQSTVLSTVAPADIENGPSGNVFIDSAISSTDTNTADGSEFPPISSSPTIPMIDVSETDAETGFQIGITTRSFSTTTNGASNASGASGASDDTANLATDVPVLGGVTSLAPSKTVICYRGNCVSSPSNGVYSNSPSPTVSLLITNGNESESSQPEISDSPDPIVLIGVSSKTSFHFLLFLIPLFATLL